MGEYRRAAGALWFFVAALGLLNVLMNLLFLGHGFQVGLWAIVTLMATVQGVFSLRAPFATVTASELRFRIALARREQTISWSCISSWSVDPKARRVELSLSDGRIIRLPLTGIRKELRNSFVNEFRTRVGAPSAG